MKPHRDSATPTARRPRTASRSFLTAPFPLTDLPTWLASGLAFLGIPRTVLADLDVVAPESGLLYYLLALVPFAAWLVVALVRDNRRPFVDFVTVGVLYGLTLIVIHQVLWTVGPSLGHHPPAGAVAFAARFAPAWQDLVLRIYTSGIALLIGLGCGVVTGLIALAAHAWRARRNNRSA